MRLILRRSENKVKQIVRLMLNIFLKCALYQKSPAYFDTIRHVERLTVQKKTVPLVWKVINSLSHHIVF